MLKGFLVLNTLIMSAPSVHLVSSDHIEGTNFYSMVAQFIIAEN